MSSNQSDIDAVQRDSQAQRPAFVLHEGGAAASPDADTPPQEADDTANLEKRGRHAAEATRDSTMFEIASIRDRYEGLSDKKWWQRRKE